MALRKTMPARDPERAKNEPQHSRSYSPSRGAYDRPAQQQPKKKR